MRLRLPARRSLRTKARHPGGATMDQDNPQSNPPSSASQPNPTSQPNPANPSGETSSPSYPFLQRPSWEQPYGQQAQAPYGQPSTSTPATGATGAGQQV